MSDPNTLTPDVQLSDAELASILDRLDVIEPWIASVRKLAHERLEAGQAVPGWKLVPKRALRRWADEDHTQVLHELTADGIDAGDVTEIKLLSPAQVEKALGKKLYEAVVAPHVTKISSGTTLAPDGDPRQRVSRMTAQEAFGAPAPKLTTLPF